MLQPQFILYTFNQTPRLLSFAPFFAFKNHSIIETIIFSLVIDFIVKAEYGKNNKSIERKSEKTLLRHLLSLIIIVIQGC